MPWPAMRPHSCRKPPALPRRSACGKETPRNTPTHSRMLGMKRRIMRAGLRLDPAVGLVLAALSGSARSAVPADAPEYYNGCISEASSRHNVIQTTGKSIYSCFGTVAQNYYEYLVSKNAPQVIDKQRTGTYYFREIP